MSVITERYSKDVKYDGYYCYEVSYVPNGEHSTKTYTFKFHTPKQLSLHYLKTWFEETLHCTVGYVKSMISYIPNSRVIDFVPANSVCQVTLSLPMPNAVDPKRDRIRIEKLPLAFPKFKSVELFERMKLLFGDDVEIKSWSWY